MQAKKMWTVAVMFCVLGLASSPGLLASPERGEALSPGAQLTLSIPLELWIPVLGISVDLGVVVDKIGVGLDPAGKDRKTPAASSTEAEEGGASTPTPR